MEIEDSGLDVDHMVYDGGEVNQTGQSCTRKMRQYLRGNMFMILTVLGICLGFVSGLTVRELHPSDDVVLWIGMPGTLYLRLLKVTIMPLVACNVLTGASRLDLKTNGKIGACVAIVVVIIHLLACSLATGMVLLIKPGAHHQNAVIRDVDKTMETHDVFADVLRNLMPDNIVGATFRQTVTKYVKKEQPMASLQPINDSTNTNGSLTPTDVLNAADHYTRVITYSDGINVLGLITVSALFGMAASKLGGKARHFLSFIHSTLNITYIIATWFIWLTPIGVLSMIAMSMAKVDSVVGAFSDVGLFALTVTLALGVQCVVVLPAMYFIVVRRNPLRFFLSLSRTVSISFASANTAVAMLEMFPLCEKKFHMDKRLCSLVIPLANALHANGSCIFILSACLFITDYSGTPLGPDQTIVALLLVMILGMAIPPIPSASIMTIIIILTSFRIPLHNVVILFAVEWILDRLRSCLNSIGDMTIVAIVNAFFRDSLEELVEESGPAQNHQTV